MKFLEFFRRGNKSPAELPPLAPRDIDLETWKIFTLEDENSGEVVVIRGRLARPERPDIANLTTAIVIKWPYESGTQMPPDDVNQAQIEFEEAVGLLGACELSELVYVSTGMGLKEWIYYSRDRDDFVRYLNHLLSGHQIYPLEIEFYDDPNWEVWGDMVAPLREHAPDGVEQPME